MRRILVLLLFVLPLSLVAQRSINNTNNQLFKKGVEFFEKGKYGSASYLFEKYIEGSDDVNSSDYVASKYFNAACGVKLNRPYALEDMEGFVEDYPYSVYASKARQILAYSTFSSEDYSNSLEYFESIDESKLEGDNKQEFLLKRAYCYMVNNQDKKAANEFYSIDQREKRYKPYADFYYANIAFRNKKYQTALGLFDKLKDNSEFSRVVPYYIIQVYYMQKKYKDVVTAGADYYSRIKGDRKIVLSRILANSYFNLGKYTEAEKYYSIYFAKVGDIEKQDNYEYGYCLYKLGKYTEAIEFLEKVGGKDDIIVQAASYCMANCYVNVDDKESARKALLIAASLDFDDEIKESALFNSAKINYELSYSPFNETLNSFDEYIATYPDSRRNDEAYDYLVEVYMQTKDYEASLRSMEKIKVKTLKIKKAYQRIAYYRGVQLFNSSEYKGAISFFDKSLKYKMFNNIIAADCVFWKAEAFYALSDYSKSKDVFDEFLLTPGASLTDNYARGYYALGYSFYQLREYEKAIDNFKSFELQNADDSSELLSDSRSRIIDYYLFTSDYETCISYCNKLINVGGASVDYALLKKARALGLAGRVSEQFDALSLLVKTYSNSVLVDEACYEAGNVAMTLEKNELAKEYFNKIISKKKSFKYDPMARLQLALIAYNDNDLRESERLYKSVIMDYKGTDYAMSAKLGLKNVMVDVNQVDDYYAFISEKGMKTDRDSLAKDSLSFAAAERLYMDNNIKEAIGSLESYLQENPKGDFFLTANYYLADSYYRDNDKDKSLPYYEKVLSEDKSTFTLDAALHAAEINDFNKAYEKSIVQFGIVDRLSENDKDKLYANWKIFQSNYYLKNYQATVKSGEELLLSSYDTKNIKFDIYVILANSYKQLNDTDNSIRYYTIIAKNMNSKEGAEAKYIICKSLFDAENYSDAEKEINEFMSSESTQYMYLAKSFMLLADIFIKKDDKFQAKYTLMSIVENYPNKEDGILDQAKKKLALLRDKQEKKEDSIKLKNAKQKTKVENKDFEKYRKNFDKSDNKDLKEKIAKAKELLNEMENTEVE